MFNQQNMGPMSYVLQLPRSCQTFKIRNSNKDQTIYIVGTAHVSAASCDDVRAVIRAVKPEVIVQISKLSAGWQNGHLQDFVLYRSSCLSYALKEGRF